MVDTAGCLRPGHTIVVRGVQVALVCPSVDPLSWSRQQAPCTCICIGLLVGPPGGVGDGGLGIHSWHSLLGWDEDGVVRVVATALQAASACQSLTLSLVVADFGSCVSTAHDVALAVTAPVLRPLFRLGAWISQRDRMVSGRAASAQQRPGRCVLVMCVSVCVCAFAPLVTVLGPRLLFGLPPSPSSRCRPWTGLCVPPFRHGPCR